MSQPNYTSAVGYIGENFVTLSFDVALDAGNPPTPFDFDLEVNGTPVGISGVTVDSAAKTVTLGMSGSSLLAGDIVNFAYFDPSPIDDPNAIQGTDGADATDFSNTIVVSVTRPGLSAPSTPALTPGTDSGTVGDGLTNVVTPTLTGTAAAGNTVKLYDTDGTTIIGSATADGSGNWSITTSTLSAGPHAVTATQTDGSNNTSPVSGTFELSIDTQAPTASSPTPSTPGPTGATSTTVAVVFSEAVTGLDASDFTLVGTGTASGRVASITGAGANYTVTVDTLAGDGTLRLDLNASGTGIQDTAGNAVAGGATGSNVVLDHTAPTALITPSTTGPTNATSLTETVTFSEAVTGVDASDFILSVNGTATGQIASVTGSGSTYTVSLDTLAGTGPLQLVLKASGTGIQDAAGNANVDGAAGLSTALDHQPPAALFITPSTPGPTNATTLTETIVFTESVTGVDAGDFTLVSTGAASGNIASVVGSGNTYEVTLDSLAGDGTVHLDLNGAGTGIQDAAGNLIGAGATGLSTTLDHNTPAVTAITPATTGPTNAATLIETVTFSEAVTGVDASDFTLGATGTASGNIASVVGSGTTYTVVLDTLAGDGTIHLDLNAGGTGIQDGSGNAVVAGATGTATGLDHTAPAVLGIVPDTVGPTNVTSLTETVTFSEAVTGVDASDFTVGHTGTASARIASITGSGAAYVVTLDNVSGNGTVHLDLNAGATGIADAVGNALAAGATGTSTAIAPPAPPPPPPSGPTGGNDSLTGTENNDSVDGGGGDDTVAAGGGDDFLRGLADNDRIEGGFGNDTLNGNTGQDSVSGGVGNDIVYGGQDNDTVDGAAGDDEDNGNRGADLVEGGDGQDTVYGGKDDDTVLGGAGDDRLSGDLGNDVLFGGAGADRFAFTPGSGQDWIGDFNPAEGDRIVLPAGTAYTVTTYLGQTVIDLGGGAMIGLAGVGGFSADWIASA